MRNQTTPETMAPVQPSLKSLLPTSRTRALEVAAVLAPARGLAQDRQLEKIVVTAQKRAESSQDVPVALTAIGSDMIETVGITQITNLVKLVPSPRGPEAAIRWCDRSGKLLGSGCRALLRREVEV